MRLPMPGTSDYWINDQSGEPLFVITAEANAGLARMLPPLLAEIRTLIGERRITIVFDRGGWSPKLFRNIIAQGFDMINGLEHQKIAVETGHFPLYRYNPELATEGKNSLQLDCKAPTQSFAETALTENRFKQLLKLNPNAEAMLQSAEKQFKENFDMLQSLANMPKS